ncbi:Hypothetical protein D9617_2g055200 [Elsinoe fawcettii]|nr:Hypothetical protein D9617_2g055200 [Elsinoe fawcettii]
MGDTQKDVGQLESLPAELRMAIVDCVDGADALTMTFSFPTFYEDSQTRRNLFQAILERIFTPPSFDAAAACLKTDRLRFKRLGPFDLQIRRSVLYGHDQYLSAIDQLRSPSDFKLMASKYYFEIRPIINHLRVSSIRELFNTSVPISAFDAPLTSREHNRFTRALFNYQACCNTMMNSKSESHDVGYQPVDTELDSKDATAVANVPAWHFAWEYLANCTCREANEVLSVVKLIQDRYISWSEAIVRPQELFENKNLCYKLIKDDSLSQQSSQNPRIIAQMLSSRGLSLFSKLMATSDPKGRASLMTRELHHTTTKWDLMAFYRFSGPGSSLSSTTAAEPLDDDDDNWTFDDDSFCECAGGAILRELLDLQCTPNFGPGYVFWDRSRLGTALLREERKQANWMADDSFFMSSTDCDLHLDEDDWYSDGISEETARKLSTAGLPLFRKLLAETEKQGQTTELQHAMKEHTDTPEWNTEDFLSALYEEECSAEEEDIRSTEPSMDEDDDLRSCADDECHLKWNGSYVREQLFDMQCSLPENVDGAMYGFAFWD